MTHVDVDDLFIVEPPFNFSFSDTKSTIRLSGICSQTKKLLILSCSVADGIEASNMSPIILCNNVFTVVLLLV